MARRLTEFEIARAIAPGEWADYDAAPRDGNGERLATRDQADVLIRSVHAAKRISKLLNDAGFCSIVNLEDKP